MKENGGKRNRNRELTFYPRLLSSFSEERGLVSESPPRWQHQEAGLLPMFSLGKKGPSARAPFDDRWRVRMSMENATARQEARSLGKWIVSLIVAFVRPPPFWHPCLSREGGEKTLLPSPPFPRRLRSPPFVAEEPTLSSASVARRPRLYPPLTTLCYPQTQFCSKSRGKENEKIGIDLYV